ncbi:response regulator [Paenibacillus antri]|uniref:Response regulator n=1 Tax=Paenibacillus antri TaxID=2582848 RepID=A0A5R9GF90_9BACL|nr:RICIN domain-containing protein [Paenibacillus antri]TLS53839.1 response regulator [Paenibacillus antri]
MLKAMIVEDNAIYRYAIKSIIDWEQCGFELAAEAVNGKQAVERLEEGPVDLIVTDISMPEMNGIELIQTLKRSAPATKVIVLSSYDDFHFVKDALKLGALDYLLKHDLEEGHFIQAVSQAREMIEAERGSRVFSGKDDRDAALDLLRQVLQRTINPEELERRAEAVGLSPRSSLVLLTVGVRPPGGADEKNWGAATAMAARRLSTEWLCVPLNPGRMAVVLDFGGERSEARLAAGAHQEAERIRSLLKGEGMPCSIGVSRAGLGIKALQSLLKQAQAALFRSVFAEQESDRIFKVLPEQGLPETELAGHVSALSKALKSNAAESIEHHTEQLFRHIREAKPCESDLRTILLDLFAQLVVIASDKEIEFEPMGTWHDRVIQALERLDAIGSLKTLFLEQATRLAGEKPSIERAEIRLAKEYVQSRLGEDLNVGDISSRLGLNANYLSVLFRRHTGQRLVEYIQQSRVEAAKKLLRETTLKVYEVAEQVGFKDTSYFCKVFKEYAAMTVSDFRMYGQPAKGFLPEADYLLTNRNSGMALDVRSESNLPGAEVIQWYQHGGENQLWRLLPAGEGRYKLVNRKSGLVLDVERSSNESGAKLVQAADNGGDSQCWSIVKAGSYFKLVNVRSGLRADVNGNSKEPCASIIQWKDTNGANQQWNIVKAQ